MRCSTATTRHAGGARGVRRLLAATTGILAIALIGAAPAAADIFYDVTPGPGAPPPTLGPYTMTPFSDDTRPTPGDVTDVPDPAGTITFDITMSHREVPTSWLTWSHGYTGDVYWTSGATSVTIGMPAGTVAFYLYAEPNPFAVFLITATAQDGTTVTVPVSGFAGAQYFGFYAINGQSLATITVSSDIDFAVGEFGIAIRLDQHFLRYQLDQREAVGETVTLSDQFGTLQVRLEEAEWLWNPAEKRRTGREPERIQRPDEHLVCYGLPYIPTADRSVVVRNQFTTSTLRVGRPLTLCTPASKGLSGEVGPPPEDLDHYLCYDVRGETPRFTSETLVVRDQFGERTIRIDRARELCNPVEKRREPREPELIIRPEEHYVCYRITIQTPVFTPLGVFTRDQFAFQTLRVKTLERLCAPTTKDGGRGDT
jgi:hypothetical protein